MRSFASRSFPALVKALKQSQTTITAVEQSCGGLIQASILAQPGASRVYGGGMVIYSTRQSQHLLKDDVLFAKLNESYDKSTEEGYIQSKLAWTAATSVAFCERLGTDYAVAEGGATGPTFPIESIEQALSVLAVAGKGADGTVQVLEQQVVRSPLQDRASNMQFFADCAAQIAANVVQDSQGVQVEYPSGNVPVHRFDRATHLRSDPQALSELQTKAKYIALHKKSILMKNDSHELHYLDHEQVGSVNHGDSMTFLGLLDETIPIFSVDVQQDTTIPNACWSNTRTTAPLLENLENSLALQATAYAEWQRRSSFCTLCGSPTQLKDAGTSRQCTSCNHVSWPRQDPSMICAISSRDGQKILLAHSARHPLGLYTVLAGFCEAGETLEAAVAREAYEETGIRVDENPSYVGSQPWPFPQSCMLGFMATADSTQPLNIDVNEIEDAQWFDKEDVIKAAMVSGPTMKKEVAEAAMVSDPTLKLLIPPKGVIARRLIDEWLTGAN